MHIFHIYPKLCGAFSKVLCCDVSDNCHNSSSRLLHYVRFRVTCQCGVWHMDISPGHLHFASTILKSQLSNGSNEPTAGWLFIWCHSLQHHFKLNLLQKKYSIHSCLLSIEYLPLIRLKDGRLTAYWGQPGFTALSIPHSVTEKHIITFGDTAHTTHATPLVVISCLSAKK